MSRNLSVPILAFLVAGMFFVQLAAAEGMMTPAFPVSVAQNYPGSGSRVNVSSIGYNFTATTTAPSGTLECTLFIDGTASGAASVTSGAASIITASTASGVHTWNVSCTDTNNQSASSAVTFIVDLPPIVVLNSPPDDTWITSPEPVEVSFVFTAYDDLLRLDSMSDTAVEGEPSTTYCTIYLDDSSIYENWVDNATPTEVIQSVDLGVHTWHVECDDNPRFGSQGVQSVVDSATYTLTVSATPRPVYVSSGGGESLKNMNMEATAVCPGDMVDVHATSSSGDVDGALVRAILSDPYEGTVARKTTDSSGHVIFILSSSGTYDFKATRSGYNNEQVSLQFALCEQPPEQNTTPPPAAPQPPATQTHLACVDEKCAVVQGAGTNACSVDSDCVTTAPPPPPSNQTNPDTQGADQAISEAQSAISNAQGGGKDVSAAMAKLAQAQAAFASGDYSQAKALAEEARQLALGAAAPTPAPQPPAASSTVAPAPTPASGGLPLLLFLLIGAVIVVVAGVAAYMMFGQKKKPYK